MRIEMISTGEEVLSGQIIDTNAAWFGDTLMNLGLELQRRSTVGDRIEDLVAIFHERSREADIILVNGGLGPTSDDLSAEAAALALNEPLVEDSGWRGHLEGWFSQRNRTMPPSNLKQCLLPASAALVDNPHGSAPGFRIRLNDCWLFFTPGVPAEFKPMIEEQLIPFIQEEFGSGEPTRLHKLLTLGHGESTLADQLTGIDLPEGVTLGYRPSLPIVEIKVFARGNAAISALPALVETIKNTLSTAVVAENCPSIPQATHQLLLEHKKTLSLAESCSGGMLSSSLVDFPGSSAYLLQAMVTYTNEAKEKVLGVQPQTLAAFGAVSWQTAREMAEGVRQLAGTDFALAITGIAGPDGGTEDKPVGLVCLALATPESTVIQTVQLSMRSRNAVRLLSCAIALDMLRRALLNSDPIVDYPFISRLERQQFKCP